MRTLLGAFFRWHGALGGLGSGSLPRWLFGCGFFRCALFRRFLDRQALLVERGVVPSPEDLVDEGLIAFALGAEVVEDVAVEAQGDDVLAGGYDDVGLVPIDAVERGHGGIALDGAGDIVVGHGVEAGVVSLVLEQAGLIAGDAR